MSRRVHKINKILCRKLGQKVKNLREEKGWAQEVLAFEAKISRSYVSCIERGETDITLSTALNIAKALDINLTELLEFTDKKNYH